MELFALSDLSTPWCLHVVVTLKVAEHIDAGTTAIGDLAVACGASPDSLHRVLRHLVAKGVFEEPEPGRFVLNRTARGLLEPPIQLALDLNAFGGRMAYVWGSLLDAVKSGVPAYHEMFGRPFWEDLAAHPHIGASFDALMGPGHGTPDPDIPLAHGWDSIRTVVDVGGGTGAMLAEILRARPRVRGTLVDRPATVARSAATFEQAGVADRVTVVGQSFFDPLPGGRDLYLLKNVLADWPDREALALLTRCAEAARPAGRLAVLGGVTGDAQPQAALLMMILIGGKERTLTEFRDLAGRAGLEIVASGPMRSGRFVVECRPVSQV